MSELQSTHQNDGISKEWRRCLYALWLMNFLAYPVPVWWKPKNPKLFLQCLLHEWISKYGPPKILLSDNGREFNIEDIRCFLDRINLRHINTAAFATFSNGIVERHNGVQKRTMDKLSYEKTKSLTDKHGFTPFLLVFGVNMIWDILEELCMPVTKQKKLNCHLHAVNESRAKYSPNKENY